MSSPQFGEFENNELRLVIAIFTKSRKSKLAIAQFDILCYAFRSAVYADMTLPPGSMSAFVYGDVCQNG